MTFPISEYNERLKKTKERMEKVGIDVLLLTDPANMNYMTGYDAWSFYVHQMVIITLEEDQPFWIGRGMDAKAARYTTWLDDYHIYPYADDYIQSETKHPMGFVAEFLKTQKCETKTIAIEMDAYYFTAKCYTELKLNLPDAFLIDGTNLVNWVRIIKSEREIQYMKKAADIARNAMQTAFDTIDVGIRQCDVIANIMYSQVSGTDEFGGDYPSMVPFLPSGEKTDACHLTWSDNPLKQGDPIIIELAGCHQRYHVPLARTVVVDMPNDELNELSKIVNEGINTAIDIVRPGITCEEVEMAWRHVIERHGIVKESRIGYSMGLNYPPDWGEHTASLRPGDLTVLEPNMTFHMIPGIWLDGIGIEISESFRVTESGHELFVDFPQDLYVKPNIRLA